MAFSLRNLVPHIPRSDVPPLQIVRQGGIDVTTSSDVILALKFENGEVSIHRAVAGSTQIFVNSIPSSERDPTDRVSQTVVLVPPAGVHYRDSSGVLIANLTGMTLYGIPVHQHTDAFLSEYFSNRDLPQLFTLSDPNLTSYQVQAPEPLSADERRRRVFDEVIEQRTRQDRILERANRLEQRAEAAEQFLRTPTLPTDFETLRQQMLPEGRSAYEIAVENGFTGTSQEWLDSLHNEVASPPEIGAPIFFSGRNLDFDQAPVVGEIRSGEDGSAVYMWDGNRWQNFNIQRERPPSPTEFHIPRFNNESVFSVGGLQTPLTRRRDQGRDMVEALTGTGPGPTRRVLEALDRSFENFRFDEVTQEDREIAGDIQDALRLFAEQSHVSPSIGNIETHTYTAQENILDEMVITQASNNLEQESVTEGNVEEARALDPILFLGESPRGRIQVQLPNGRTETLLTTNARTVGGRPLELLDHLIMQGVQGERGAAGPQGPAGIQGPPGVVTPEAIVEFFRNRIQIRSQLNLIGTELSVKTSIVLTPSQSENETPSNEDEQILSEDEDFVDISDILSQGNE